MTFKTKGFTLVEILVTIAIIGVLTTAGIASYSGSQKRARDAKRKIDLRAVQNALEQYFAVCGSQYPTTFGASIACASPAVAFMQAVPSDPRTGVRYSCTAMGSSCTSTSYSICTNQLEAEIPATYCITNQQ